MTSILLICCLFNWSVIAAQSVCIWSSWSSSIQCEWIKHHCMKGYHRYCLCDNVQSQGSACSSNRYELRNYIETKPFVSNFNSVAGVCFKENCKSYKNWCPWEAWSYWSPVTNITCERRRIRKCCESQPKSGYTVSIMYNYGCFVSRSSQNHSDLEIQLKQMQCSKYTKWYYMTLYIGIGIVSIIVFCIVCRFTKSSKVKTRYPSKIEEIEFVEMPNTIIPTAPTDQPIIQSVVNVPNNSTSGLPTTPPSYDESIGFNNFTTVPVDEKVPEMISEKSSISNSLEDLRGGPNTGTIPPPSYALYLRNPVIFNQNG